MDSFLIEFRLSGYAKKYSQRLISEVARKFRVRGMQDKVSHITLFGPFTTKEPQRVAKAVREVCRKYGFVAFRFKGFNFFNNPRNKVIYLDIDPSDKLKSLRYELAQRLLPITHTKSSQDRKSTDKFYFHSTIAFKDIDHKFNQIWTFLKSQKQPCINNFLIRVTIIKRGRIMYEYDLLQKRLLNRRQALSRVVFRDTVHEIRQNEVYKNFNRHMGSSIPQHTKPKEQQREKRGEPSLFKRIKQWLGFT